MNVISDEYNKQTCSVICLGTELIQGYVQDKHAVFLGQELKKCGIAIKRIIFLPDDFDLVEIELLKAISDSSMVIISGGLGPTSDDLTRDIVAQVVQQPLVFCESEWERIKKRSWGKEVPKANKKQAYIPAGFSVIKNDRGTACGFYGKTGDTLLFVLPGPPTELQPMFLHTVVHEIHRSFKIPEQDELICSVYMVSESYLEDCFQQVKNGGVSLHTRLDKDRIVCTLLGGTEDAREKTFSGLVQMLGDLRIRKGNSSIGEIIYNLCVTKHKVIGFAESCTGGLLSSWITDIPGSSRVFWGGFIVYSNHAKSTLLGVNPEIIKEHGAVSEEVVLEMAAGVLKKSQCHVAVAVSGIAGPGGGSGEKPVGTVWIGLCTKDNIKKAQCFHFNGDRNVVRKKSAVVCFFFAEYALLGKNILDIPLEW